MSVSASRQRQMPCPDRVATNGSPTRSMSAQRRSGEAACLSSDDIRTIDATYRGTAVSERDPQQLDLAEYAAALADEQAEREAKARRRAFVVFATDPDKAG